MMVNLGFPPAPPRMTRLTKAAVVSLLLIPLGVGGFAAQRRQDRGGAQLLDQVLTFVALRYVDTVAANVLYEKAARGLVKELGDPYSELFTPKDRDDFTRTTNGRYFGVGMLLTPPNGGYITVDKVFPNTPAESRGVQEGDRIAAVDTFQTRGWRTDQVQAKLLGDAGTHVAITFQRAGVANPITLQFTRAEIHVPAVSFSVMLDDRVGYIPLARFTEQTTHDVSEAVVTLRKEGAKGIVIDLRGNPGGIVDEAYGMSNLFLPKGKPLLTVRERASSETLVAEREPLALDIPLVVLVDGGSASAAEIVAGALQDYDRALVLGTTTYGKGLVQTMYGLDGGYALKITTGRWFTPSGRSIQKPRAFNADGQFVETLPDSLETDAVRAKRPIYKSTSGRTLYGGGAITPDVIVPADTITKSELQLRRALAPHFQTYFNALTTVAESHKRGVAPSFRVERAWRDEVMRKLAFDSVRIDKAVFDAGGTDVDRALASRIAKLAFGEAQAKKYDMKDDNQLLRAVALLRKSLTQKELFVVAR